MCTFYEKSPYWWWKKVAGQNFLSVRRPSGVRPLRVGELVRDAWANLDEIWPSDLGISGPAFISGISSHISKLKNQLTQKVPSRWPRGVGDTAYRPEKYSKLEKNILKNIFFKKWIFKNWKLARVGGCGAHSKTKLVGLFPHVRGHHTGKFSFPTCYKQKISWPKK